MAAASNDVWEVMSTARTIRRFTDEPVDDAILTRCLEAATQWAYPTIGCSRATSWWAGRRASTALCAAAHLPRR
jgi:Nitroreductase family